jgi:hypothetical protein
MTAQEADSLKVGDRVQTGTRTGVVEFVVSDVFLVKWDGGRDSDSSPVARMQVVHRRGRRTTDNHRATNIAASARVAVS